MAFTLFLATNSCQDNLEFWTQILITINLSYCQFLLNVILYSYYCKKNALMTAPDILWIIFQETSGAEDRKYFPNGDAKTHFIWKPGDWLGDLERQGLVIGILSANMGYRLIGIDNPTIVPSVEPVPRPGQPHLRMQNKN